MAASSSNPLRSLLKPIGTKDTAGTTEEVTTGETIAGPQRTKSRRRALVNALKKTVDRLSGTVSSSAKESARESAVNENDSNVDRRSSVLRKPSRRKKATEPTLIRAPPEPPRKLDKFSKPLPEVPEEFLTEDDLTVLLSGAPHFALVRRPGGDVLGEGQYDYQAVVTFPFGGEGEGTDYRIPGHTAFSLCTSEEGPVKEVPSMLSFMGSEPGTSGWEYFLLLPVGDVDRDPDLFDEEAAVDEGGRERGGVREAKNGVRSVELGYIVERFKELGTMWLKNKEDPVSQASGNPGQQIGDGSIGDDGDEQNEAPNPVEMYTHLFAHLLFPPTRVTTEDYHDPYSLSVQIMALIQTLTKKVWLDFSNVRWRIKLGQILWGNFAAESDEHDEWDASVKEGEKVWLLLQILIACELVVRLDSVLSGEGPEGQHSEQMDQHQLESKEHMLRRFREAGGVKVEWDIILARRWLENVRVVGEEFKPPGPEKQPEKQSFLAPPTRWFTSQSEQEPPAPETHGISDALLLPRHPRRQTDGLLYFAQKLRWPNIDAIALQAVARSSSSLSSVYGTPLSAGSPMSTSSTVPNNSYFSGSVRPKRLRTLSPEGSIPNPEGPTLGRKKSSMLTMPAMEGAGGWLSRSYLTGLVLPGEGLSHLVMSTLLECDTAAVDTLGFSTNLYGGFQYSGKTWWSRYCIVGRIMAAYDDAGDECGWVGPVMGSGVESAAGRIGCIPDGWLDVVCLPVPEGEGPRALEPEKVGRDAGIKGRKWTDGEELRRSDFVEAMDLSTDRELSVQIAGLFFAPFDELLGEDVLVSEFPSFECTVNFLLGPTLSEKKMELRHDISLVSAWPCFPPDGPNGRHPLHQSYEYTSLRIEKLDAYEVKEDEQERKVAVVNVWSAEQRVLVQSWCSLRGWNMLVARRGRTCLACAVREAFALGVGVVLRV